MKLSEYTKYFVKGADLVKKSHNIILIGLIFGIISNLDILNNPILKVLMLPASMLQASYYFSFPKLLNLNIENKINIREVSRLIIGNTVKLILPLYIIAFLCLVIFALAGMIYVTYFPDTIDILKFTHTNNNIAFSPVALTFGMIISFLSSYFIFTPIYYLFEKMEIFTSLKRSAKFSNKNLKFIISIALYNFFVSTINYFFIYNSIYNNLLRILFNVVYLYLNAVTQSAAYLLYKDKK